jgi:fatty acid desaturase
MRQRIVVAIAIVAILFAFFVPIVPDRVVTNVSIWCELVTDACAMQGNGSNQTYNGFLSLTAYLPFRFGGAFFFGQGYHFLPF